MLSQVENLRQQCLSGEFHQVLVMGFLGILISCLKISCIYKCMHIVVG